MTPADAGSSHAKPRLTVEPMVLVWRPSGSSPPRHNEMSAGKSALLQPTPTCSLSKTGLAFGKTKGNRNGGQQNQTHRIKCGGVY